MKILFFGSSDYSYASLMGIIDKYDVIGIVTQPDKLTKGQRIKATYLKEKMISSGIPIYQPYDIKREKNLIEKINPDMIIVAAYGQIFNREIIDIPKYGCINIHASYLPYYKGASPIRQVIIDNQEYTGISSIFMNENVDAGDVIIKEKIKIDDRETYGTLYEKFLKIIPEFTVRTIEAVINGKKGEPQEFIKGSYTKKIEYGDSVINWQEDCLDIDRKVRAFAPDCGVKCLIGDRELKIYEAKPLNIYHSNEAGEIIRVDKDFLRISCGMGYLDIYQIQVPGKKITTAKDFINGNRQWLKNNLSTKKYS